eukprot:6579897-Alexandrium_andersonii.AAC.1
MQYNCEARSSCKLIFILTRSARACTTYCSKCCRTRAVDPPNAPAPKRGPGVSRRSRGVPAVECRPLRREPPCKHKE